MPVDDVQPDSQSVEIPSSAGDKFDDIFEETKGEQEPKADEPKEEAPVEDEPKADEPKEEAPVEDEPKAEASVEEPEPSAAEELLRLYRDPDLLNSALQAAGVETIQELPIFKEVLGRERQSASDQTRAEIMREVREAALVESVLTGGDEALDKFVQQIDEIANKIANADPEQPLEIDIPSGDVIKEVAEDYARSRVTSYHNQQFLPISEFVYALPEMQGVDDTKAQYIGPDGQPHFLVEANGKSPSEWVDAHLQVMRNNLWVMAQNAALTATDSKVGNERKVLEAGHKAEVERLTKKHEKAVADAVKKAKDDARAEAMADFAKGTPPRVPNRDTGVTPSGDDDIDGDDFDSIALSVARQLKKSGGGGV